MKREIKFRTESLEGEFVYFGLHESRPCGDPEVFYIWGVPCKSGTEQQYTGLKDKNGKEIYEGDIVKWDDCSNGKYWRIAEVIFRHGMYGFKIINCINCDLKKGYTFIGNFAYQQSTHEHLEIIGNN